MIALLTITTVSILLAIPMGHWLIARLLKPFGSIANGDEGLDGAGRLIGYLERFLILLLIISHNAGGITLLVAAKSILRFPEVKNRAFAEYVIIGTLASFGWAMLVGLGAQIALKAWAADIVALL